MKANAILRNSPIAPRKMRLIVDTIRGKHIAQALDLLKFERKAGAPIIEKLLRSAIANWKNKNEGQEIDNLYITQIFVTDGKTLKRFRPAPQGRAYRIRKRSNHITIEVDQRLDSDHPTTTETQKENE